MGTVLAIVLITIGIILLIVFLLDFANKTGWTKKARLIEEDTLPAISRLAFFPTREMLSPTSATEVNLANTP